MNSIFNKKLINILIIKSLIFVSFGIFAQNPKQNLSEALQNLNQKRGISFAIDQQKLGDRQVNKIKDFSGSIEQILTKMLKNTGLTFKKISDNTYTIIVEQNPLKNRSNDNEDRNILPKKFTLSGYVHEQGSAELLPGVTVYLPELKMGTSTNSYGFYSITVSANENLKILFSSVGYQTYNQVFSLTKNIEKDIFLSTQNNVLSEVIVRQDEQKLLSENPQMSILNTPVAQMQEVPALLGEKDMLKVLQLMPGVHKGAEGSSGLYVRGGGPDQNLIILDDAPVYNAFHLFGFFSLFNGDALKNIELTKGGFPARFGGRLSSVIEIQMKEGNKEALHGDVSLGLVSARATLEGPIQKGKSSYLVSGRRTYFDLFLSPSALGGTTNFFFYDFNAKMNFDLGRNNKLYVSGYFGRDDGKVDEKNNSFTANRGLYWRNATATLRWNHLFSEKVFLNTSLIFSDYRYKVYDAQVDSKNQINELSYGSSIDDLGLKMDLDWLPNPSHTFRFGLMTTAHRFTPSAIVIVNNAKDINTNNTQEVPTTEAGIYAEDQVKIAQNLRMNLGLRGSFFKTGDKNYLNAEPRISLGYTLPNHWAVKSSYALMNQYIHLLTSSGEGLPTDLWVPATEKLAPQRSEQVALGLTKDLPNKNISISLEGYYKKMNNIIAYKSSSNSIWIDGPLGLVQQNQKNPNWDDKATSGQGWAYGMELFFQKKIGRLTGWAGYTISWTEHQFAELNFGEKFYAKYDRRHDASIVGIYELTPKIRLSSTWVYGTGNIFTLPVSAFQASLPTILPNDRTTTYNAVSFPNQNNYRAEAYHRLDINVQFHKKKKGRERFWDIGIYNVYNRYNPFYYETKASTDAQGNTINSLKKNALFPFIPSISYRIKF
jgi:outer membrane receptor for ferrienterochelin and colicin